MKPRFILPLFSILLAMLIGASGNKAEAADGVRITIGGGQHRPRGGGVVQYRTVDPGYTTWYPKYDTSRDYPVVYQTSPYRSEVYQRSPYYGNYSTPYEYRTSTPSVDFNVWFGSDGRRHYGRRYDRR